MTVQGAKAPETIIRCDVAVVGAGPAGAMAAWGLAMAGVDVAVIDRSAFPRDKVCGDALLPDAVQALEEAGLATAVRAHALAVARADFRSPGGRTVGVRGEFLTIRRHELDALLLDAAVTAGARFVSGLTAAGPSIVDGSDAKGTHPCGVLCLRDDGDREIVRCRAVVLCCGSSPRLLGAFGVLARSLHSAIAIRAYLPYDPFPGDGDRDPSLLISYERSLLPGYGWSFPLPGNVWNVGCGVFLDRASPGFPRLGVTTDLRALLRAFLENGQRDVKTQGESTPLPDERRRGEDASVDAATKSPEGAGCRTDDGAPRPAAGPTDAAGRPDSLAAIFRGARGATLRTGFTGALAVRGRVLVAGEALGLTLPLTGDGIGKAMQSGLLAARSVTSAFDRCASDPDLRPYARDMEARTRSTHRAYAAAQRWMRVPAVGDFVVRRASRSPTLRSLLEEIVSERADPRTLLSPAGLVRAAFL